MSFLAAIRRSHGVLTRMAALEAQVNDLADEVEAVFHAGGKLVLFGNGGSAADCQHLAAEFVVRYRVHRRALPALALTVDASALTAQANDCGFETVFARQVEAIGRKDDLFIGLSTSGRSANVVRGLEAAAGLGAACWAWTGSGGCDLANGGAKVIRVPSDETARIQEAHLFIGHWLCEEIDRRFATDAASAT